VPHSDSRRHCPVTATVAAAAAAPRRRPPRQPESWQAPTEYGPRRRRRSPRANRMSRQWAGDAAGGRGPERRRATGPTTTRPPGAGRRVSPGARDWESSVETKYGQTRIRQARFILRHRREGRAGTTILQLVSTSDDWTKALIIDYGPAGAAGARATPPHPPEPQDRSTGLRAGGGSE
jgi:hypothetical protein